MPDPHTGVLAVTGAVTVAGTGAGTNTGTSDDAEPARLPRLGELGDLFRDYPPDALWCGEFADTPADRANLRFMVGVIEQRFGQGSVVALRHDTTEGPFWHLVARALPRMENLVQHLIASAEYHGILSDELYNEEVQHEVERRWTGADAHQRVAWVMDAGADPDRVRDRLPCEDVQLLIYREVDA